MLLTIELNHVVHEVGGGKGGGGLTLISSLVKNDITLGVWIEKDRRTIGTGDAGVFLIRGPTIQKREPKPVRIDFFLFSSKTHTSCLIKNTIPQAVCRGFLEKMSNNSEKGSQNLFILIFFFNETHTSCLVTVQKNALFFIKLIWHLG